MKRLLKEPLLHFLVLGALLFGAYAWLNRGASARQGNGAGTVRITTSDVAWLADTWARQRQRPPTREELRGLVTEYLKEELLAREARAMGLDQDDLVVRRRLAQKLEFLVQDTSRLAEPTDEDLRRIYEANLEQFQTRARISFTHVFFNRESRSDAAADAKAALAELSHSPPATRPSDTGDPWLLDAEVLSADEQTVSGQFGTEFARAAFALQPGAWHGPIESAYGLHLVRVSDAEPAKRREFAEVKAQVLDLWRDQRQREDYERYFAALLKKYDVVVDENLKPFVGPLVGPIAGQAGFGRGGIEMKATLLIRAVAAGARRLLPMFVALAVLFFSVSAFAHELRPAYLELREVTARRVQRVVENTHARRRAARARTRILRRRKGDNARHDAHPTRRGHSAVDAARARVARTNPAHPRAGKHDDGHARTDRVRRWHGMDAAPDIAATSGGDPHAAHRVWQIAGVYLKLGVEHILTGSGPSAVRARLDHYHPRWMDVGEDRHRVHCLPQHHAHGGDARIRACAAKHRSRRSSR